MRRRGRGGGDRWRGPRLNGRGYAVMQAEPCGGRTSQNLTIFGYTLRGHFPVPDCGGCAAGLTGAAAAGETASCAMRA